MVNGHSGLETPALIPNAEVKQSSDLGCTAQRAGSPRRC